MIDPRIYSQSLQSLPKPSQKTSSNQSIQSVKFKHYFQAAIEENSTLKISKHAEQRMNKRGINISTETWSTIESKVSEAKQKGVRDSLVITNNAALVVSAKNNTVITVLDREEAQSQIFTNINGTILID